MGVNFEWVGVDGCAINVVGKGFNVDTWDYTGDEDGDVETATDGPSIILGADNGVVITGNTWTQLTEFARAMLTKCEAESTAIVRRPNMDNTPKIYVASLSDYNAGTLHGIWINLYGRNAGDIRTMIGLMLKASPTAQLHPCGLCGWKSDIHSADDHAYVSCAPAEEYAIHDSDGFGPITIGEHEDIDAVVAMAQLIIQHGDAASCWLADNASEHVEDLEGAFNEAYLGEYASISAYADRIKETVRTFYAALTGDANVYNTWPLDCIDWTKAADEVLLRRDANAVESGNGTVFIFSNQD